MPELLLLGRSRRCRRLGGRPGSAGGSWRRFLHPWRCRRRGLGEDDGCGLDAVELGETLVEISFTLVHQQRLARSVTIHLLHLAVTAVKPFHDVHTRSEE